MLNHLVNHRCHLYQGTDTSTISAGHAMLTARRPSLVESLYSSSVATLIIIPPFSVVRGPETARNPSIREPSSDSRFTCCPGSGTRGGLLLLPNVILHHPYPRSPGLRYPNRPWIRHRTCRLEARERLGDRDLSGQNLERLVIRYTTCRLYGRRELVGDVYFGSAVFGATYCDLLN